MISHQQVLYKYNICITDSSSAIASLLIKPQPNVSRSPPTSSLDPLDRSKSRWSELSPPLLLLDLLGLH